MDTEFWVGFQESVGIAKALAAKNSYEIDSNQEVSTLLVSQYRPERNS